MAGYANLGVIGLGYLAGLLTALCFLGLKPLCKEVGKRDEVKFRLRITSIIDIEIEVKGSVDPPKGDDQIDKGQSS